MRIDDELIDATLRSDRSWQPPAGFAERVATRGASLLRGDMEAPQLWSWANVAAVIPLGVLTAVAVYFAGDMLAAFAPLVAGAAAAAPQATWLWVVASLAVAAWFTLRPHAFD